MTETPRDRRMKKLLSGWHVWTTTECDYCGSRYKVSRGGYYNPIRHWILRRFGK